MRPITSAIASGAFIGAVFGAVVSHTINNSLGQSKTTIFSKEFFENLAVYAYGIVGFSLNGAVIAAAVVGTPLAAIDFFKTCFLK